MLKSLMLSQMWHVTLRSCTRPWKFDNGHIPRTGQFPFSLETSQKLVSAMATYVTKIVTDTEAK